MANIKIVLRKEVKKDGTSPLAIRITKDRKSSYIYLEYSIPAKDWDDTNQRVRKSYPNAVRLNNYLLKKLMEVTDKALELEGLQNSISSQSVKKKIKPSSGGTVFIQADLYISNLKADGKFNQYTADKPRVKHLKEYLGQDIRFQELTLPLLERYRAWLKKNYKMSERSAVNHLVVVRSIFSQAIKAGVVEDKYYPFGKGGIKIKFPDSLKIGLSEAEIKKLEDIELETSSPENHARNAWLFSLYFAGMRVSDLLRLKWSDFQNDRLHYSMGKNNKGGSLKVPEKALSILNQYKHLRTDDNDYVFPQLKPFAHLDKFNLQKQIANIDRNLNKWLRRLAVKAEIKKPLTMHIARHTFGNLSGDKIPIQMLQKLYRHSSVTTTIGYQANFIHKDTDDALDNVLNF